MPSRPVSRFAFTGLLIIVLSAIGLNIGCGGAGGGTGGTGPTQNPVPVIAGISPASAASGGVAFTLTATGTNFISSSQVAWNAAALTTSFVSSTELHAEVPASDFASAGSSSVTIITPAPGGGTSSAKIFTITSPVTTNVTVIDLQGNDLVWDPQHTKIYVSVPSTASANRSTIATVDLVSGTVVSAQTTDADPGTLAISDDGQFLYTTISGDFAVQRFTLPSVAPDIKWTVGTDPTFGVSYTPTDVKVEPGVPHTVAVIRTKTFPGDGGVAIYDDSAQRPNIACSIGDVCSSLQWKADGSAIYVEDAGSSTRYFYALAVSSAGTTLSGQYGGAFRGSGTHLHLDPSTNYAYSDLGEVVNAANGLPVGNYPAGRCLTCYADSPTMTAVDSSLHRVFFLTPVRDAVGQRSFELQVFDQSTFVLLGAFSIANAIGTPANFIRWGQSGLAFVTNGTYSTDPADGKLYLVDGLFVNPSGATDSSSGTAQNLLPTLTSMTPLSTTVGSNGTTITVTGVDFVGPTVMWNGNALATTSLSDTQLQATIPTADLTSVTQGTITVTNSGPIAGSSNALLFSVNPAGTADDKVLVLNAGGNDLVWDGQSQRLYIGQPSVQGPQGNSIATVDPVADTITNSAFIGSDPSRLSLSGDNQYLYVGLNGQNSVERLVVSSLKADISWPLGADSFLGPYHALDVLAAPGLSHTSAVSIANFDVSPSSAGISIYDDGTARSTSAPGWNSSEYSYASLQWGSNATTLYAPAQSFPTDFYVLGVTASGVSVSTTYSDAFTFSSSDFGIHYDGATGLIYSDGGQVVDPTNGTTVGNFNASGFAASDSSLGLVFFLGQTSAQSGTSSYTIQSYNQQTFALVDSITISNVVGTPTAFVRWGTNGLAFTTRVGSPDAFAGIGPGQLYVVSGTIVKSDKEKRAADLFGTEHVHKTWDRRPSMQRDERGAFFH